MTTLKEIIIYPDVALDDSNIRFYKGSYILIIELNADRNIRIGSLDVIRFTPSVLGNIMKSQLGFRERYEPDADYMLFDETRIMLGESIFKGWFLSYRGQYGLSRDYLSRRARGR